MTCASRRFRLVLSVILVLGSSSLTACFGRPKLDACKFIEIETPEFEVEVGDVDIEGGEVEMVCGDDLIDVPWGQFRQKLRLDPKDYITQLASFEQQVNCFRPERSNKKEILCQLTSQSNSNKYKKLTFNYDD